MPMPDHAATTATATATAATLALHARFLAACHADATAHAGRLNLTRVARSLSVRRATVTRLAAVAISCGDWRWADPSANARPRGETGTAEYRAGVAERMEAEHAKKAARPGRWTVPEVKVRRGSARD